MYRIALYEVGMNGPIGAFFTLPSLPGRDVFIEYEGRAWRVTDVIVHPHAPGSRQYGTDAPVLAEVIVMPGKPVWRPNE